MGQHRTDATSSPGEDLVIEPGNMSESQAPWPAQLEVQVPGTVTIRNQGQAAHQLTTAWQLPGPTPGSPRVGGASSTTLAPATTTELALTSPGRLQLTCPDHAFHNSTVLARLATPTTYEVAWSETVKTTTWQGNLSEAEVAIHVLELPRAPVLRVEVELRWDDRQDDLRDPEGATVLRSDPDTFHLGATLEASGWQEEALQQARQGMIGLVFAPAAEQPTTVEASNPWEAWQQAGGLDPLHPSLAGTLKVEVLLEDVGHQGTPQGAGPLEDPGNAYELSVRLVLAHAHPEGPGTAGTGPVQGTQHADQSGHDHGNHVH